ncbi:MAG: hypothetical protein QXW70_03865 [Candidatus Anstonellales archaeon]
MLIPKNREKLHILVREIESERNMTRLARLLSKEEIPILGVHILYPETNPQSFIASFSRYLEYKERLISFVSALPTEVWKRTILFVESESGAKVTSNFFFSIQAHSYSHSTYFMSTIGEIESPYDDEKAWRNPQKTQFNIMYGGYDRIRKALNDSIIFVFGCYKESCIRRVTAELRAIAMEKGRYNLKIPINSDLIL